MRKYTKHVISAALLAATSMTALAGVSFSENQTAYVFDGTIYQGQFDIETSPGTYTTYGVSSPNNFNVNVLDSGFTRTTKVYPATGTNAIYRFYKQPNSVIVGNIVQGDSDRSFVKAVIGENPVTTTWTKSDVLPNNANYDYTGVVFNHIAGTEGVLDYNISVSNTGVATGSGSFSGVTGNRPSVGAFTLSGTLGNVTITDLSTHLGATGGSTSVTLADSTGSYTWTDSQYDIGVYGANADEVAGGIYGGTLEDTISGYGIAGTKVSP